MNINPQLTAEEFRSVHNGLCDLRAACERLEDVIAPHLHKLLLQARDQIRDGLQGAYDQEERAFVAKQKHYDQVKKELDTTHSEWSIYEVDNMADRHPFEGADRVVYRSHWGPKPVSVSVNGLSWSALWMAANACIRDSGDSHHVFIEHFEPDAEDPRTLLLSTGS